MFVYIYLHSTVRLRGDFSGIWDFADEKEN
jgi:hypothetical protein